MKKILCPTDFSDTANNAVAYAAKFAQQTESELVLLNIQSLFALVPGEILTKNPPSVENTRKILESQAKEVTAAFKISCYSEVEVSDQSLSSLISSRGNEFDMVIMGTNGPDDLYQFFFGTNTYHVFRKSGVPVLLIPDTIRYSFIKRIVYAYDYLHLGIPPLEDLNQWLPGFDSELHILQLTKRELTEDEKVTLAKHKMNIKNQVDIRVPVVFDIVRTEDYADSIQRFMLHADADLLVLNTHHYSIAEKLFHKSLTKKIAMDFMYPVLVVHL